MQEAELAPHPKYAPGTQYQFTASIVQQGQLEHLRYHFAPVAAPLAASPLY